MLSKVTPGLTADEAYEYSDSGELYALAALDGSWATGFDFEGVMSWDGGMAGILNARDNEALLYNEAGQVVLDTRELEWLDQLAEYKLYNLLQGCAVRRTDNSYALIQGGQLLDFSVEVNYCAPFD